MREEVLLDGWERSILGVFYIYGKVAMEVFLKCKRGSLLKQRSGACSPEGDEDDV